MSIRDLFPAWQKAWILFEDADLVAVDKPCFVSTHAPDEGREDDAHSRLTRYLRERGEKNPYLGIHQRLDRDTSGVLVFTRRKEANRSMAEQFEGRKVKKTYVAAVSGLRGPDRGVLKHKLVASRDGAMRALPANARDGQEAITRYQVISRRGDRALLSLQPETGRTHQIRVQLAAIGAPIAGDPMYGGAPATRLLLHATRLELRHPTSGKPLSIQSTPPSSFERWVAGEADALPTQAPTIEALLRQAADRRYGIAHLQDTTAFRLANGAGDALPGVDVDVYGDHLVVALSGDEAVAAREAVLDAVFALGPAGVYVKVRPKHASVIVDARREDFAPREPVRGTAAPDVFTVQELGLPFRVRLGDGLSTGVFLDQRENRRRVRLAAPGTRVLNLFAYTGPFTVAAVAGGARSSVTVDVSAGICAWARQNLDALGADPSRHEIIEADVLPWLTRLAPKIEPFDLAVLDPPSFATTKQSRFSAGSDYREVAALVLRVLAPGGRLLACTNHRGIPRAKLRRFLHEAARDAGREVVQMKDLPDPEDYPPAPGHEPHLKSVLVTLADRAGRAPRFHEHRQEAPLHHSLVRIHAAPLPRGG
ncbi:LSU m5C1962 methyltransferase RlmI [Minicystis rosea]|nr:LSU m5C1962 methyltransferase RlmI [Minicystis rosea]